MNSLKLIATYAKKSSHQKNKSNYIFLTSRIAPNYKVFSGWMQFIDSYYKKYILESAPAELAFLPLRTCFSNAFTLKQRVQLLTQHYKMLSNQFDSILLSKLLRGDYIKLSQLTSKNSDIYEFGFFISSRYKREGQLTLYIKQDGATEVLSTCTFLLGNKKMIIGGMQGPHTPHGKEIIVKATRNLNGLRPKYALLECAYAVAKALGVKEIIATSSKNCPQLKTNNKKQKTFYADYDAFWEEQSGKLNQAKDYDMPTTLPKRKLEDVPSKKKKDWLKRQEFLTTLQAEILENLCN